MSELVSLGNGQYEEKPKSSKYRPFRDTDELIKVWTEKGGKWQKRNLTKPCIWVQMKGTNIQVQILGFNKEYVKLVSAVEVWKSLPTIFKEYTFLDGSPCGVKSD